jgi:hypothetical protein
MIIAAANLIEASRNECGNPVSDIARIARQKPKICAGGMRADEGVGKRGGSRWEW